MGSPGGGQAAEYSQVGAMAALMCLGPLAFDENPRPARILNK